MLNLNSMIKVVKGMEKDMEIDLENEKILLDKNGKTIECDILFTFDSEDTMKSYVGYTDNSYASNGRKNIYVSAYNPFSLKMKLENISDQKELDMINEVLIRFDEEASD